jgi:hypothetical protein
MDQKSKSASERRKFPRKKFQEEVIVHKVVESKSGNVFEVQGTPLVAKAQDVSEGGMRLEINKPLDPTNILKLNFKISKSKNIDLYSKLAWAGDGTFGLQFIVVDSEVRRIIRSFVEKSL